MRVTAKQDKASAVRAALLPWLARESRAEVISGIRVQRASVGRFEMLYRTPFSPLPEPTFRTLEAVALFVASGKDDLPYGLDVWERYTTDGVERTRKVLNLQWGHKGETILTNCRAGDWDADLLQALDTVPA